MSSEIIITALISAVTGVAGWFAARRQNLAEVQSTELDNVEKAVKYYRDMLDDMAGRHKSALAELNQVRLDMEQLQNQVKILTDKIKRLCEENRQLLDELKKYKQLNGKRDDNIKK